MLSIDGEVRSSVYDGGTLPEQIQKALVSKSDAYIGPPTKHTRWKAREVGVRARVSCIKM